MNVINLLLFCFYSSNLVANVITWKARYKLTEAFRNIWSYAAVQHVKLRSLHRFVEAKLTCRHDSITFDKIHHPICWQPYESNLQSEVSFVWKQWAVTSGQSNGRTLHGAIKLPNYFTVQQFYLVFLLFVIFLQTFCYFVILPCQLTVALCVCVRACVCVKRNVLPCFVVIVIVNFTIFKIIFCYISLITLLYCYILPSR